MKPRELNFKMVLSFLGLTAGLNGVFMLLSVPFSLYHDEKAASGILLAGALTIVFGFFLWFFNRKAPKNLQKREGYIIVTLGWLVLTFTGALPYLFTGTIPNFVDAIFETISGYSTTGASIINDIEILPKGILFWRSATHWIGGMGIIVLTVAILPLLGIGGMQLFLAEAPGPSADKMHPRITQTAKRLWLIYVSLTLTEFLLLKIAGMTWFDAINHAMATMSTGGFSTKNTSMAYYNHMPVVQYIVVVFMFIAGTNFVLTYFALKGKIQKIYNPFNNHHPIFSGSKHAHKYCPSHAFGKSRKRLSACKLSGCSHHDHHGFCDRRLHPLEFTCYDACFFTLSHWRVCRFY
jgi:trk system potassium uptake protein TrkH